MIKRHKKFKVPTMRRSSRIFLVDINAGKQAVLVDFLHKSHDITQYFVDLFWQRKDFSSALADLPTVHRGCERFDITTRLAQALAKQAKETVRAVSEAERGGGRPQLRNHTTTLCSHFVSVEKFTGSFDYALKLGGAGVPKMIVPIKSTAHLNRLLGDGWTIGKTIRLGRRNDRLFVDLILEKARPPKKKSGSVVGMDSNYKHGLVFSDGQTTGMKAYEKIGTFSRRQKNTHAEIKSIIGQLLKGVIWKEMKVLCIEDLKNVKRGTFGKFPKALNRRLSHWMYSYLADLIEQKCEEHGIRLERKNPWKTSQFCRHCLKWDRRSRKGDKFTCVHCGFTDHADHNAAKNLEFLGLAGTYGLRSLQAGMS